MMMRNVTILHKDMTEEDRTKYNAVAIVSVPGTNLPTDMETLEAAYIATQNVEGSWSMDLNDYGLTHTENIKILGSLHEQNGRTFGLRSSMVGDRMVLDGTVYEVSLVGFKEV